ncbi:MAG: 4-(cytidine 5'-diphospho)-2-C-methyl-D-erythritol kinase, partial [Oscillospiraceae bacterium]|nr:4-(cytidine 5'-diphospho)-2-C-methyl-D-erythritol kinase [Oscillospiraceae bacterium]
LREIALRLYNVFEEALPAPHLRMVTSAKRKLLDLGALSASMSGSGSAVFGLFESADTAESAFSSLKEKGVECYLTKPSYA